MVDESIRRGHSEERETRLAVAQILGILESNDLDGLDSFAVKIRQGIRGDFDDLDNLDKAIASIRLGLELARTIFHRDRVEGGPDVSGA